MVTKGFTPGNGAKVFAIMKNPPGEPARPRGPARPGAGHQITFARLRYAAKSPYLEHLHNTRNDPRSFERHMR